MTRSERRPRDGRQAHVPETTRSIVLHQRPIPYHLRRSRRKTIGLRIGAQGLQVTAPTWVSLTEVERILLARSDWILRHLQAWAERQEQQQQQRIRWETGGTVPYLGVELRLQLEGRQTVCYIGDARHPRHGDTLELGLSATTDEQSVCQAVHAWLKTQAREVLEERLQAALRQTGRSISGWRLSSATTRWGSCNSRGRIMLNWRLIHLRPYLIDYVIAHELAHLREMNHSPAFWAEVEVLMPDYREAREQLRRVSLATLPTF